MLTTVSRWRAAALAGLCLIGLSACNARRATMDGGITYRNFSPGEIASTQRCELRTCILAEPSYLTRPIAEVQSKVFSRVATTTDMLGGNSCDIGFRYRSLAGNNDCDVLSAYTNEVLLHIEAWIDDAARIACRMLGPNEALGKKLAAQRLAAGRAAPVFSVPASAAGVSSEQLAKLVSDAVKNTQPSAPPAAPSLPSPLEPSFHSRERPDDLAVIVGIETYSDIASKAPYAERDAAAVKAYIRALGVPERNIVLLTGSKAVRSALTKNIEGWLPRMTKPDSRVYFYFSGHGAPDVKTSQAYLVPWDGDPNFLEATAYPVAQLYKKLGELPAKQVLVAMDSCFSGAGGRSVLASGARPLVSRVETGAVPAKLTVLAASAANEISGSLDDKGHGAFTYFLLEGLNAGKTTPKALNDYLTPLVQDEARRLNRDQTPQLQGGGDWPLR